MSTYSHFRALAEIRGIPAHCQDGVAAYCADRRPVGNFLSKMFSNDFRGMMFAADEINLQIEALKAYAQFLMFDAPPECWGSRDAVQAWIDGGVRREK